MSGSRPNLKDEEETMRSDPDRGGSLWLDVACVITATITATGAAPLLRPRQDGSESVRRGINQIRLALLQCKQWARRDKLPTGIRLVMDTDARGNPLYCTSFLVVQAGKPLEKTARKLPQNVLIDFQDHGDNDPPWTSLSRNIPVLDGRYEILVKPNGEVIPNGTDGGQIVLWVRGPTKAHPKDYLKLDQDDITAGNARLITIELRKGIVRTCAVAPGRNPYAFTDGK
jgi:hypothetical protein